MFDFERCEIIPRKNISGMKFGKLTVLHYVYSIRAISLTNYYKCLCECGSETIATTQNLRSGNTRSCGCMKKAKYLKEIATEGNIQ
jgi:hypothetical protein